MSSAPAGLAFGGEPAATPSAIDAYVYIDSIRVVDRHRKDLGSLSSLASSIRDIGLLNPITITPNSRLIAGQRRLEACRQLGWVEVPARIVADLAEATALLHAERDENTERKEMLLSEKASLGEALYALESEVAKGRQGTRTDLAIELPGTGARKLGEPGSEENKARSIVADAIDMAPRTYTDLRYVYRVANGLHDPDEKPADEDLQLLARSCLTEMDRTGNIRPHATRVRAAVRARREAAEAKSAALAAPVEPDELDPLPVQPAPKTSTSNHDRDWVPAPRDNSVLAAKQRRVLLAALAGEGNRSAQIAEHLGVTESWVRRCARDDGIAIPADEAVGRARRIDSNRVVRETVYALDGLAMGVQLVNVNVLDPAEIDGWASSMTDSIRALNRLVKQLKEKTREA